jgi:hypothetical protein
MTVAVDAAALECELVVLAEAVAIVSRTALAALDSTSPAPLIPEDTHDFALYFLTEAVHAHRLALSAAAGVADGTRQRHSPPALHRHCTLEMTR